MDGDLQNDPDGHPAAAREARRRLRRRAAAGARTARTTPSSAMLPSHHGQPAHLVGQRRAAARLRLLAEGVSARGHRRRAALRRDAPLPADLRQLARRGDHRGRRAPLRRAPAGSSKYGLERVLKVLADLVTVKFLDRFQQKPMYLFGAVGLSRSSSASSAGSSRSTSSSSPRRAKPSSKRRCRCSAS